jgi:endonuclease/exonuclease/phosphatase (EEP) superfamily protein YafD
VKLLLVALGVLMILATVLPFLKKDEWWVRIFDFPRLQITLIIAVVFAAYLPLRGNSIADYGFLVALILCLTYQSYMMYPYTRLSPKQVQWSKKAAKDSSISLLFANVLIENHNAARLKEIIKRADPDLILTAETDDWWRQQLKEFDQTHPHVVAQPQDNSYGILLQSRLELINPQVKFLVQEDIPSIHTRVRLRSGMEVELRGLHPRPPVPEEDGRSTERDAELLVVGKEVKGKKDPIVVLGDLNDVAWSRTNNLFQDISGLLDPRIGRGFYHTFHARYPFIRFPLDHFFHSNHFRLVKLRRLPYFGSDHFPVYIKLNYEPDAESEQEELHADQSQKEEAEEKIDQVR